MRARRSAVVVLLLAGCAGSAGVSRPSCITSYNCSKGQTCSSSNGLDWECVASGPQKWGDSCNASGPVTCGDRLSCVSISDPHSGTCDWDCDAGHPCSAGACAAATNPRGVVFHYCAGGPCADAYDCPAGQTCATADGFTFACVASGSSQMGDSCSATANAPVTCGDHLACAAAGDPSHGTCARWCSVGDPCPPNKTCLALTTSLGAAVQFCL